MENRYNLLAALLLLIFSGCYCQQSLYRGEGFATYYYDVEQPEPCSSSLSNMNSNPTTCGLSPDAVNSNNIVAINLTQLSFDMSLLCGKQVVISVNDKVSNLPLFVGDGCERCAGGSVVSGIWNPQAAPGLDLSYSVLNELADGAACAEGYIQITWEIRDVLLYDFNIVPSQTGPPTSIPASQASTPTISSDCSEGSWRCSPDSNVLEQCLYETWTPRATCAAEYRCKGDSNPYCGYN